MKSWYEGLIDELAEARCGIVLGLCLLFHLLTFRGWSGRPESFSSQGLERVATLPVWFFEWLPRLPESLIPGLFSLFGLLAVGGLLLSLEPRKRNWSALILLGLTLAKVYFYFLDLRVMTTFHHMHLLLCGLLLFPRNRVVCLRLGVAAIYFGASLGKLNDSWLDGRYFSSIADGLPILGTDPTLLTWASRAVVALEAFGPFLLLWPARRVSLLAVGAFTTFHLYSSLIVGFYYPTLMTVALAALFLPWERPIPEGLQIRAVHTPALLLLLLTVGGSALPHCLPGDVRLTGLGRHFGTSNMFDANRSVRFTLEMEKRGKSQTVSVVRVFPKQGFYGMGNRVLLNDGDKPVRRIFRPEILADGVLVEPDYFGKTDLRTIGDPYLYLYFTNRLISRLEPDRFHLSLDVWLNGEAKPTRVLDETEIRPYRPWGF